MEDDWDLQAVVRSCITTTSTATPTTSSTSSSSAITFSSFQSRTENSNNNNDSLFCFHQDLIDESRILLNTNSVTSVGDFEELHELCKPFIAHQFEQTAILSSRKKLLSPISIFERLQDLSSSPSPPQQQQQHVHQLSNMKLIQHKRPLTLHAQSPRNKRRKNQLKKVCHVAAAGLSSDMWSWRKYGQKPIKGSPYPRGYYKCSTSKGCLARKQVERNRSDPNMFIVTYTAEHNHPMPTHRNSLAGISRQKTAKPTASSPAATNSPAPENQESIRDEKEDIFEDDDDEFGVSDVGLDKMEPDDDFFDGLDELEIPATGEISGDFAVSLAGE